ncbi:MAG: cupin domain-containing protein [Flavobacteriaceae bacterium]|nr:MAG: cupin domain-containing protein [Flavobacteriaceae bacterium]
MGANEFKKGEKFNFNASIDYAENAVVSKHVLKKNTGNISLFAFDKGEGLSEHTTPFDALVHIVDGEAEITIDGRPVSVKTGESIVMPANIPHALKAIQQFKMVLTMIRSNQE